MRVVGGMAGPAPAEPPRKPPYLALPPALPGAAVMALGSVAERMAVQDGDYSHLKNSVGEAASFLDIARRRHAVDRRETYAALLRAAAIIMKAAVALDEQSLAADRETLRRECAEADALLADAWTGVGAAP